MKRNLFVIIISIALLLATSVCSFAYAESSETPTLDRYIPISADYVDLNRPHYTAVNGEYMAIVHEPINSDLPLAREILIFKNGEKLPSITVDKIPSILEIYKNYAFISYSGNPAISVYDLNTQQQVTLLTMPTKADYFVVKGDTLYHRDDEYLTLYDLTDIANDNIIAGASHEPYGFFTINGTLSFTAHNGVVYYEFNTQTSDGIVIYAHDTTTNQSNVIYKNVRDFTHITTDGTYLFTSSSNLIAAQNPVIVYDLLNLETVPVYPSVRTSTPENIAVYNGTVYLTNTASNKIDYYTYDGQDFNYYKCIGTSDSTDGRFKQPSSVYNKQDAVIVADYGNDRVVIFNQTTKEVAKRLTVQRPLDAIGDIKNGYIISNNKIYTYTGFAVPQNAVQTEADGVAFNGLRGLMMDNNGTVYCIDKFNNRVLYRTTEMDKFATLEMENTPLGLTMSHQGSVIYAIYSDRIDAYDTHMNIVFSTDLIELLSEELPSLHDVDSDINGNLYILSGNNVIRFSRTFSGFDYLDTTALTIDGKNALCKSISISRVGTVLLTGGNEHCVYELKNSGASVYNPDDYLRPEYKQQVCLTEAAQFVKVREEGGFMYEYKNNFESTHIVPGNTTLLLLSNEMQDDMYFVYYDGNAGYLPAVYATKHEATVNKYPAYAFFEADLYKYPILDPALKLGTVQKDGKFDVITDAYNYVSKDSLDRSVYWNQIELSGKIYYIQRSAVVQDEPEIIHKDYGTGKLVASAMGSTIKLYSPINMEAVIGEYADGTEVKLLEAYDGSKEYTKVEIEGKEGYVKTNELTTGGMTTAQIVILILILLGGAASVTILIISRKMYRKK